MKKIAIGIGALGFALDLWVKQIVSENLNLMDSIVVIRDFFEIRYIKNFGAAWGVLSGKQHIFLVITPVVLIGLAYYFMRIKDRINAFGLALIFFGALGNFYDRLVLGFVRDMFSFNLFGYDFPVFNIADSMVVVGVGLLILASLRDEMRLKHESRNH